MAYRFIGNLRKTIFGNGTVSFVNGILWFQVPNTFGMIKHGVKLGVDNCAPENLLVSDDSSLILICYSTFIISINVVSSLCYLIDPSTSGSIISIPFPLDYLTDSSAKPNRFLDKSFHLLLS